MSQADLEAELDWPIAYMARTRAYYVALGFETPYRWAHNVDAPFAPLARPLAETRVALVTTAARVDPGKGDQGPGAAYNGAAKFFEAYAEPVEGGRAMGISHIAYDRAHIRAEDPDSFFPLARLRQAAVEGRIGGLTNSFFGLPTNRSQATTIERDAPALLELLRAGGAEAAILVAICPVCHQSVSLAARHLEAAGLPTVVMGCAKDIVEHAGAPRFLFSDFPLGAPAGKPFDAASQRETLDPALRLLEQAPAARTTLTSPQRWSTDAGWKRDYSNAALLSPERLAERRAEFDAVKRQARAVKAGG